MKPAKSDRPQFAPRTFNVRDEAVRDRLVAAIQHMPVDGLRPLEVVIREVSVKRRDVQNALYWALLNDIASQAWIEGKQYSADVLHEYMKRNMLPEDDQLDPADVREGYLKWKLDPAGDRVLIGSTTMLTVQGFAKLINGVEAFGAQLGVQFGAQGCA